MKKIFLTIYHHQFFRFLAVGVLNTLFGYGVFAFFLFLGLHYALAVLFGTVCGVLFNFKTVGIFVFKTHDNKRIFRFIVVYIVVYGLNVGGISWFETMQINAYTAGAVLLLPVAIITFIMQKKFVFNFLSGHSS